MFGRNLLMSSLSVLVLHGDANPIDNISSIIKSGVACALKHDTDGVSDATFLPLGEDSSIIISGGNKVVISTGKQMFVDINLKGRFSNPDTIIHEMEKYNCVTKAYIQGLKPINCELTEKPTLDTNIHREYINKMRKIGSKCR